MIVSERMDIICRKKTREKTLKTGSFFLKKGKKFDYNISSYEAGRYCEISFGRMHTVSVRYLAEKGKDYERTESK